MDSMKRSGDSGGGRSGGERLAGRHRVLKFKGLVIAAIVPWNTTYLQRAAKAVRSRHPDWDDQLLQYLSPLGVGAHQPERRLPLAHALSGQSGEITAAPEELGALAYAFSPFL
ncbi:MAG: hypothetical protein EOP86_26825 [Verrucomicrobiaceae bacterium]|nr:MAG: hypothetical protein EOP86_26825 [Verrucomicrobiaceae bacterium]